MTEQPYKLGQRWISNTEPELGLGIITDNENRRVSIQFPAAGERRTYASDNAPVTRVQYQVGDEISNTLREKIIVSDVTEEQGYIVYGGVDEAGNFQAIPELELNSFVQFRRPQDRLFSGQIDKLNQYALRYQTLKNQTPPNPTVQGLLGPRVQLLPHQLHIAREVATRFSPRVLLADEVGLGKTIEAGLIIHHQLHTGRAERILIAVPDSLVHQWLVEMLRRFNLSFTVLDEERCEALAANDDNPFFTTQLALCSLSFLSNNETRQQQAVATPWDLLVVDEAHHLEWSEDESLPEVRDYRCVEALAKSSKGLLLLTATPEQLGERSHFARLRLLDPDRYFDFDKYHQEEQGYRPANDLVQELLADNFLELYQQDTQLKNKLLQFVGEEKTAALIAAINSPEKLPVVIDECVQHLLDHHGTGRVLFRNTRAAVKGFPQRQLIFHPITAPKNFAELSRTATLEQQLKPELLLGSEWLEIDTRVAWLADWLKQHRSEKVLLICNRLDTTLALEDYLRLRKGVRSAAFHEELSLIERDRAGAYFADEIDGAQVLICSEIGSEGRNFQFARHLILFDLPMNPDLLEQRIGRLARIGQQNTVQIHVPFYQTVADASTGYQSLGASGASEKLLAWYHQGINAIEQSCAPAQSLFQTFETRLLAQLTTNDDAAWQTLLQDTQATTQKLSAELAEGRDRLLELNSCNLPKATALIDAISTIEDDDRLEKYMSDVFSEFGVEEDHHSAKSIVLHPTEHMHNQSFPGLTDEGLTATFDRDTALSREDMEFLTWEHPMVLGAMDMVLDNEAGNNTVGTIKLPPIKAGTLLLETIFSVHCPAPKAMQLNSYFDVATIRLLVNEKSDLSKVISLEQLNKLHTPVANKKTAQGVVKHAKADIMQLLQHCQTTADSQKQSIVDQALERLQKTQGNELHRLQTLAKVNPNIRAEEITQLEATIAEHRSYLEQTQLSLEMLRVIVCT